MPSTTRYRRGDIVLVSFPFTDLSSSKRRPALVISPDAFNQHGQDVVLVAITSQEPDDKAVALKRNDFVDGGLPKDSFVKPAKIFTMHSTMILKRIAMVVRVRMDFSIGTGGLEVPLAEQIADAVSRRLGVGLQSRSEPFRAATSPPNVGSKVGATGRGEPK
jgi:mRNA interferase MazF